MFTKTFNQLTKNDTGIAGGKGASLGEMTNSTIPVPPGFVVLAGAFDRFLEETDLDVEIKAILKKVSPDDIGSVERASKKIRDLIADAEFPKDIKKEILDSFEKLNTKLVAVRSSATAEDSSVASWAGELESYLNTDSKSLLKNVKKCWSSLFTPRAIFYRWEKNLQDHKVSVAVVVQKMVQSEISGIAFTVHPVTEDRNQMVIEAGYGLGEAIVGGMITPDTYVISKSQITRHTLQAKDVILDKNISEQQMMIVRSNKGTAEKKVPKNKQELQKIEDKKIIELAKVCLIIEKHYKFPCDIEWAFEKGKFYIVQSRPITTL
jgi:pyruvate,water dikinase